MDQKKLKSTKDEDNVYLKVNSFYNLIVLIKCFLLETLYQINCLYYWILSHFKTCLFLLLTLSIIYFSTYISGPHQVYLLYLEKKLFWCGYWVGLGILSSVGFGTGLHTFLLYLGPHIASVTLAAYECNSLDFPEPPYPEEIICPENVNKSFIVTIWKIMSKVRLEAFMWGAGTALGELPPYFMARTARLSEKINEDEESDEEESKWFTKAKVYIKALVEKVGFFGILACASVPNPFFDLAGITCGHFLVPFWTFFGATLIGKAIIKMHIQKLFVIVAFNEHHFEYFVDKIKILPYVGKYLYQPFREFLAQQKKSLHRKGIKDLVEKPQSWLSWAFDKFVLSMVLYFLLSIVYSMAQSYYKRNLKKKTN